MSRTTLPFITWNYTNISQRPSKISLSPSVYHNGPPAPQKKKVLVLRVAPCLHNHFSAHGTAVNPLAITPTLYASSIKSLPHFSPAITLLRRVIYLSYSLLFIIVSFPPISSRGEGSEYKFQCLDDEYKLRWVSQDICNSRECAHPVHRYTEVGFICYTLRVST